MLLIICTEHSKTGLWKNLCFLEYTGFEMKEKYTNQAMVTVSKEEMEE